MQRGIQHRKRKFAPGANGLHAARKTQNNSGDFVPPAMRHAPPVQSPFEQRRTVQPQIHEDRYSDQHAKEE